MSPKRKGVQWPDNMVNMPDPHNEDARIVGFRILPGHPWYGLGLSDPLFALDDAITANEEALAEMRRRVGELAASLEAQADQAYVRYIDACRANECKGEEIKLRIGAFGKPELDAHEKAASLLSKHQSLMAAAKEIRTILAADGEGGA